MLFSRNFSGKLLEYTVDESKLNLQLVENTIDTINKWLDNGTENIILDDVENDILAAAMKKIFLFAPAAGGIVASNAGIVAIERNGIPDLPKGHIEKGESPDVAALREVQEETSLSGLSIIKQLPSTYHCYLLNGNWIMKKTHWFLMSLNDDFNPKPQQEEGISKVFLLNKNNVEEFLEKTYVSLRFTLEEELLALVR